MQRAFRLIRSDDFATTRRAGRSYPHRLMVLVALPNDQGRLRVGVIAGRAVGNAVARNRAKRVLRAAMRSMQTAVQSGWDVILIARAPLLSSQHGEVVDALGTLLRRAKLVLTS